LKNKHLTPLALICRILSFLLIFIFLMGTVGFSPAKADPTIPDGWIRYTNNVCRFTVYLPSGSILQSDSETDVYLRVSLPIVETNTNLIEKYVEIECNSDPASRKLNASQVTDTTEKVFNQIDFMVQSGGEGEAGNLYQATKYSAEQDGKYALLEFVLHSGDLSNYGSTVSEFDYSSESAVFEEIMNTFVWGTFDTSTLTPLPPAPSDGSAPRAIVDLKAFFHALPVTMVGFTPKENNVRLTWTSPNSESGNVVNLDLRYSDSPLGDSNWESATRVENLLSPISPGRSQEILVNVPANKRIYFGIKSQGQNGNWSPISNIPSFFDTSFRPIRDGYRFCNKGSADSQRDCNRDWLKYPAQLTDIIAVRLFGKDVCRFVIAGKCVFDPIIRAWIGLNSNFDNGLCFGMSSSSFMLTTRIGPNNWNTPGDFQPGANFVSEISEQNGNSPVIYYQVTQNLYPIRDNLTKYELNAKDLVEKLYSLLAQKDYPILVMGSASSGHAIFPYAIEDHSDGTYSIWVYDPNWPPLYDDHPEERSLSVTVPNNTWQYAFSEGSVWSNRDHNIIILPSSLFKEQLFPHPLTNLINVFSSIGTNIAVENSAGQSLRNINGEFVNQIPNAHTIPYLDANVLDRNPSYELPLDSYTYFLAGDQGKLGGITQFGTDYSIVFDNLVLNPAAKENILISPDGKQIVYKGANPQKLSLSTAFRESQQTLGVNLAGLAVNPNQPLSISTDINKHSIVMSNISSGGNYSLTVERFTSTTYDKYVDISLPIAQNDTQIIDYGEKGDVKVLIDHLSDGSIDEQRVLSRVESQTISPYSFIFDSPYFIPGGLGILCLGFIAIGGVFIFTRSRKSKRNPAKSSNHSQTSKPISSSAEQIKVAIQLAKSKRLQEAFEILRKIVESEPNNVSAWFNLGGVLADMGNLRDSERCYSRAKKLGHPKADEALKWLKQKRQ